jgi:two-component system, NarL family, nitrate/nitrite response regulator NarL
VAAERSTAGIFDPVPGPPARVCVTQANSIDEVLARISEVPDLDLVLLDTSMPGMQDFAGLRQTVKKLPDVPIVVTSPTESRAQVVAAIRNGARGFIPLSATPCVLRHALPLVLSGEFYIPASALCVKGGPLATDGSSPRTRLSADEGLTTRQREVAAMLAAGNSNKEIARELKVFEGTVKLHVKNILRKLGVRNRTEAVLAAARAGYLPTRTLEMASARPEYAANRVNHELPQANAASPPRQAETNCKQQPIDVADSGKPLVDCARSMPAGLSQERPRPARSSGGRA